MPIMNCNCCCTVYIKKIDSIWHKPLPGAVFSLTDPVGCSQQKTTDKKGTAVFCLRPCVKYTLCELRSPKGYEACSECFSVCIDRCGVLYVNGQCVCGCCIEICNRREPERFSFVITKTDEYTDQALAGAEFELRQNEQTLHRAVSNQNGELIFDGLLPGRYILVETKAPEGYKLIEHNFNVVITKTGEVFIDGQPAAGYRLTNAPHACLIFKKVAVFPDAVD